MTRDFSHHSSRQESKPAFLSLCPHVLSPCHIRFYSHFSLHTSAVYPSKSFFLPAYVNASSRCVCLQRTPDRNHAHQHTGPKIPRLSLILSGGAEHRIDHHHHHGISNVANSRQQYGAPAPGIPLLWHQREIPAPWKTSIFLCDEATLLFLILDATS